MNRHLLVLGAATLFLTVSRPVAGQAINSGAYEGLFQPRREDADPSIHHKFDLNLSAVAAQDDDLLTLPVTGVSDPNDVTQSSGFNTTFVGSGSYSWVREKMQLGVTGSTAYRYYNEISNSITTSSAGVGLSAEVARRTNITLNQTFAYSPPYLYGLFPSVQASEPGSTNAAGPDYLVNDAESYNYLSYASLSRGVTRRGTALVAVDYSYTDFVQNSQTRGDVSNTGIDAQYQQGISRNAVLVGGYHFRIGELGFGGGRNTHEHGVTFGVDYTKRLSPTRRVIFRGNLGSTMIDIPESLPFGILAQRRTSLTGDAGADVYFARSWQARASYRRGMEYVADVVHPILADGFTGQLNGQLAPRVDLLLVGGYSNGESALLSNAFKMKTYTGDVRVRFAITRAVSTFGEYIYYYYDYSGSQLNAPNLIPSVERNGVRAGLTVWFSARRR